MNIAEIEASLPWGLHDALLQSIAIDWPKAKLTLAVRVKTSEHQDFDRACEIQIDALVFCSIDAPEIDPKLRTTMQGAACPQSPTVAFSTGSSSESGTASFTSAGAARRSHGPSLSPFGAREGLRR